MAFVLTTASQLTCPHGAAITLSAARQLLTVDGQAVLVRGDLLAATIAVGLCPNKGSGQTPCTNVVSVTGGLSTVLRVGGEQAALDTATGLTNGFPTGSFRVVTAAQTKLEASQ
jgi:hypothetical protein